MSDNTEDENFIKLHELGKLLEESTDKNKNLQNYKDIIELSKMNIKTKLLGAQLIPRYFIFFTSLKTEAFETYLDVIQEVKTKCLIEYVTGEEFGMFMEFWKRLSSFGESAHLYKMQKIVEVLEGVTKFYSPKEVPEADGDVIDKFILCMKTAIPFFERGAQGNRNFANYLNKHTMTVFDKLTKETVRKINILRAHAKKSLYPTNLEARQMPGMPGQTEQWVKKVCDRPDSLNLLPNDCKEELKEKGVCHLTEEGANLIMDLGELRATHHETTLEGPFLLNDDGHIAILCCRMQESEFLPFSRLTGVPWKPILSEIRNQLYHLLCWAYASSDQFRSVRQLHYWGNKYSPLLCTWYLSSYCDPEALERNAAIGMSHHCYGFTIERSLLHIQRHGIPKELVKVFDCANHHPSSVNDPLMKKRILKHVRRINTLEEALQELQWQPIGADVINCKGLGEPGEFVYYGPAEIRSPDPTFLGYHSVVMAGLEIIDEQLVAVCKDSHGELQGDNGYIYVSLATLIIPVGVSVNSKIKNSVRNSSNFVHLLSNFVAIDMELNEDEDEDEDEDEYRKRDAEKDDEAQEDQKEDEEDDYVEYIPKSKRPKIPPHPNRGMRSSGIKHLAAT